MLPFKRFTIALITSLGLAGSAIAAPIAVDLTKPELLAETVYSTFAQTSDSEAFDIDLSSINLSYGIQNHGTDFNFLKTDIAKTSVKPIRVPEPNSILLLTLGLIGLTVLRRRKH